MKKAYWVGIINVKDQEEYKNILILLAPPSLLVERKF